MSVEFKEAVYRGIPILNDEGFINGQVDINEKSAVHYLIYPFLNVLGYNVFNPEELKLNVNLDGNEADVLIADKGNNLAVFKILSLKDVTNLSVQKESFARLELNKLRSFNSSVIVLTNGLEYVLYSSVGEKVEELIHFNLLNFVNDVSGFVSSILVKEKLVSSIGNSRFFTEKLIETKLGNLRSSDYLIDIVKSELTTPSDELLTVLAKSIIDKYCSTMDIDFLRRSLKDELRDNPGELLKNLLNLTVNKTVNKTGNKTDNKTDNVSEEKKVDVDPYTQVTESDKVEPKRFESELGKSEDEFAKGKELNDLLRDESDDYSGSGMDLEQLLQDNN
jgi:hypothetical protein